MPERPTPAVDPGQINNTEGENKSTARRRAFPKSTHQTQSHARVDYFNVRSKIQRFDWRGPSPGLRTKLRILNASHFAALSRQKIVCQS